MNFTFTWILDKFGFQAKPAFDFPVEKKPAAKEVAQAQAQYAEWHEIEALEDGTVFVNVFAEGKY